MNILEWLRILCDRDGQQKVAAKMNIDRTTLNRALNHDNGAGSFLYALADLMDQMEASIIDNKEETDVDIALATLGTRLERALKRGKK